MILQRRSVDVQAEGGAAHGLRASRNTAAAPEEFQEDQRPQAHGWAQARGEPLAQVAADILALDPLDHASDVFRLRPTPHVATAFWHFRNRVMTLARTWSKSRPVSVSSTRTVALGGGSEAPAPPDPR